ncbi:MAG: penicillin acylase family protein [Actinomycetota bacterium]|nr:penicillin acylase family protein [Actinomycetota bacterium]
MNPRSASALALVLTMSLALGAGAATGAESPPNPAPFDHVQGGNVVPPGNTGHIPATSLVQALAGTYENPNMTEQRDLYVAFDRKDWSFAVPGAEPGGDDERDALGDPYSPREGVTIYRDGWGVPRIFGETDLDAQFGAGYAMAEDRLFQADVFRHVARGEMASFVGGQTWYDYDRAWRAEFYTDEELMAMADRFYTADQIALLEAYRDGINAYMEEALLDPSKLPAEYVALSIIPEPWEVTDSLSVAVLQARDSVEGFGQELSNARLLQGLTERLGGSGGRDAFSDIRFYRDPGAYTTAPPSEGRFPYPGGGFEGLDARGVAIPDPETTGETLMHDRDLLKGLDQVGLGRRQASNAITVTDDLAEDGEPILLGGPQLRYLVPSIFYEFELHSPSQQARGVGFPGTAGLILIGKSPTHAWSITYGYTDQVDVFLVPLDEKKENHYLRKGKSKPMETYTTTIECKADHTGMLTAPAESDLCDGLPLDETELEVRRIPEYGPVIGEVKVDGKPHAVVKVRGHWMREVQNARPFLTMNSATTMDEFHDALRDFNVSLNINYVDDRGNAGFWHVARPPIREKGTDVRLPTIGDGRFDWTGYVPLNRIPHAINPKQGYTANWNNQISTGWHNGDQNYWGELQRVNMLARAMGSAAKDGSVTPAEVWGANRYAAYQDGRWFEYLPLVRDAFASKPGDDVAKAALKLVLGWDGQRTASQDEDEVWRYDSPAVEIFDRYVTKLQQDVMKDELGDDLYEELGPELDVDFYHLKSTLLLRFLQAKDASLRPVHDWLDGASAGAAMRAAFLAAVEELAAELGTDPSNWRGEAILTKYEAVGLGSVEPHPVMNRGTYNQLAIVKTVRGR